tara:strand:+ start:376 stop:690 length:315 start_codon:yes stop_codon:yes gene_type:complete
MPGKSKEGGGLESTPVYKRAPFTLKSGNSPLFKDIGAELKAKYKGTTQTTDKTGKKIGYSFTEGDRALNQADRSKQVAKGNTDTAREALDRKFDVIGGAHTKKK